MPPDEKPIQLKLQLNPGKDNDPEELDRMTRQLLSEIQELDVESAYLVKSGAAPEGSKTADAVTIGSLAVLVLPTIAPKIMDLLQSWAKRGENRTVKIKSQVGDRSIELEYSPAAMSSADLDHLVKTLTDALQPGAASQPPAKT